MLFNRRLIGSPQSAEACPRWTDSSSNGVRWRSQHARRPPLARQVRPPSAELGCSERHVRGAAARPTGISPTSSNISLLSLCYDGGARGIPGRVACRGRLRLEQRHRVDRDGRDDRDDGVDDEALRRVGVVRGAAHFGAAGLAVVRREARPAVGCAKNGGFALSCDPGARGRRWRLVYGVSLAFESGYSFGNHWLLYAAFNAVSRVFAARKALSRVGGDESYHANAFSVGYPDSRRRPEKLG